METASRGTEVILPAAASLSPARSSLECASARLLGARLGGRGTFSSCESERERVGEGLGLPRERRSGRRRRVVGGELPWTRSSSSHSNKHFFLLVLPVSQPDDSSPEKIFLAKFSLTLLH